LRCFDCCFLSAFPEEDECLFFGGNYRIKLVCLRFLATHQNFAQFARFCVYLDAMVNGSYMEPFKLKKNDRFVIDNLLKYALNKQSLIEFDEYILESFIAFRQNKQEIILNLTELKKSDGKILNLLMHPIEKKDKVRENDDFVNCFRDEMLLLFPNVNSLVVNTHKKNSLSMIAFLLLIRNSNLKNVIVKGEMDRSKWIEEVWETSEVELTQQYEKNGFGISCKEEELDDDEWSIFEIVRE